VGHTFYLYLNGNYQQKFEPEFFTGNSTIYSVGIGSRAFRGSIQDIQVFNMTASTR